MGGVITTLNASLGLDLLAASRDALARWGRGSAADITHVVVHSCTGFGAPGIDFHLIKELGLRSSTRKGERAHRFHRC